MSTEEEYSEMKPSRRTRPYTRNVQAAVLKVLKDHVGEPTTVTFIQDMTGLSKHQVQNAIFHLKRSNTMTGAIDTVRTGKIFRYDGPVGEDVVEEPKGSTDQVDASGSVDHKP